MIRLSDGSTFLSHDLNLLESLEFKQRIKHIVEIIEEVTWEDLDIDPDVLTRLVVFVMFVAFYAFFFVFPFSIKCYQFVLLMLGTVI